MRLGEYVHGWKHADKATLKTKGKERGAYDAFVRFETPRAVAADDAVHRVFGNGHESDLHVNVRLCRSLKKFNLEAGSALRMAKEMEGKCGAKT